MEEARYERILKIVRDKGEAKIEEIATYMPDCTHEEISGDIRSLEKSGNLMRLPNGAVCISTAYLPTDVYLKRAKENTNEKLAIAQKAVEYIERGRSIFVDSGTTMMFFAQQMPDEYLSVFTSGVNIAMELIKRQKPSITLIGGQVNRNTIAVSGSDAAKFIENANIDVAFVAASSYSLEKGFATGTYTECEIKREVINRSNKKIILMDNSKFNIEKPFSFAHLEDIDLLITNGELSEEFTKTANLKKVEIVK